MHSTAPPKHQTWRGALLPAPKMTPWRCSRAWGPAWFQQPLLLPVLPTAILMAMLSPRVSAGVPGILRLLCHTRQLQQGTPPGWDIWDSPLPPLHQGQGTQTIHKICFFPFSKRLERPWRTHLSRRAEPRPGRGRWQEGWAGSSSWALPSGDSPAGDTRWPQSPGLRRAPCPAPPALPLQRVPAAVPAI